MTTVVFRMEDDRITGFEARGHSSCYDLTVNTSVLGVEKTAEALEAYIRAFQEQD